MWVLRLWLSKKKKCTQYSEQQIWFTKSYRQTCSTCLSSALLKYLHLSDSDSNFPKTLMRPLIEDYIFCFTFLQTNGATCHIRSVIVDIYARNWASIWLDFFLSFKEIAFNIKEILGPLYFLLLTCSVSLHFFLTIFLLIQKNKLISLHQTSLQNTSYL